MLAGDLPSMDEVRELFLGMWTPNTEATRLWS